MYYRYTVYEVFLSKNNNQIIIVSDYIIVGLLVTISISHFNYWIPDIIIENITMLNVLIAFPRRRI